MRRLLIAVLLLTCMPAAIAQYRFEAGVQLTGLDVRDSVGEKPLGVGGRFGYNLSRFLTAESEFNYFPQNPSGNFGETQAVFGAKVGGRFEDVPMAGDLGLFAKVRPGVIHFGGPFFTERNTDNRTKFALDLGMVIEHYFKTYGVVRIDFSDVIIPFGDAALNTGTLTPVRPHTSNNFQVTIGLGVRF